MNEQAGNDDQQLIVPRVMLEIFLMRHDEADATVSVDDARAV